MDGSKLPVHNDENILSENFKDYFINKIEDLRSTIEETEIPTYSHIPDYPLIGFKKFKHVTKEEVSKMIGEINKTHCSRDPYDIKLLNLNDAKETLADMWADIINSSFDSGTFPDNEKQAIVRPLLKQSKDKDDLSSYRPLYNTSILGKIHEEACLQQLLNHLENFEGIPKFQSAYR